MVIYDTSTQYDILTLYVVVVCWFHSKCGTCCPPRMWITVDNSVDKWVAVHIFVQKLSVFMQICCINVNFVKRGMLSES